MADRPIPPSADSPATPPAISPALRQRLQIAFERGRQLSLVEKNHDYAHEMFSQCVIRDPGNLAYVEAMMENLKAKFHGDPKQVPRSLISGGTGGLKKALAQQDWPEVFKAAIIQLNTNPWHVLTLHAIAEACAALHFNEVELVYLKQALDANPKDPEVNRHCARSLARMGQYDQAIACWHRVELLVPGDREAPQMISRLTQEKVRSVLDKRELSKAKTQPGASAVPDPVENETQKTEVAKPARRQAFVEEMNPRQRLEAAIAENPQQVGSYLELAFLLCGQQRWEEAQKLLERCVSLCGEDPRVRSQLESATVQAETQRKKEQRALERQNRGPRKFPWLEICAGLAGLALLIQLIPGWGDAFTNAIIAHGTILLYGGQAVLLLVLIIYKYRSSLSGS